MYMCMYIIYRFRLYVDLSIFTSTYLCSICLSVYPSFLFYLFYLSHLCYLFYIIFLIYLICLTIASSFPI